MAQPAQPGRFTASNGSNTLGCGANTGVGRNAVLVFALPALPAGEKLRLAQLEVVARRNFVKTWEADLWSLGIKGGTSPILVYHGAPSDPAPSGLSAYLRALYESSPTCSGGQYLFLRINPEKLDMSNDSNERYDVFAAGNPGRGPKLHLSFQSQTAETKSFWRVGYGLE